MMTMEYEIVVTKRGETYKPEHRFTVLVREDMLYKTYRELKLRFPEYKLRVTKYDKVFIHNRNIEKDLYILDDDSKTNIDEKDIPKHVIDDNGFGKCPECGYIFNSELRMEYEIKHCPECGQLLDWSYEE